ncbi:periplasmic heavy metal sensor [Tropicimonas sp. IMCC6043]|uniref:periplasmic heavy metal sensor n=1 Tax=Tropicimonas sp. IMCC6043 TaxID=2510645 RepID=UPI00101B9CA9|nr:periplasmic heavy metal sensor [Tropicimonas sp. IMCC6043]RYH11630.1 periplasmic heavy metal sensor [Tropicimonas sp. IMCC6043]
MTGETPTPIEPRPPRRRTGLRILLFLSLALNLAVIGIVGGAYLNVSRGDDHPWIIARELGLGPFVLAMDSNDRRALDRQARSHRGELREDRDAWRRLYIASLEAIRSEPFDADRFRAVMEAQADLAARSRQVGVEIMTSQLEGMNAAERAAFADRLANRSERWGRMQDDRMGDGRMGDGRMGRGPRDGRVPPPPPQPAPN